MFLFENPPEYPQSPAAAPGGGSPRWKCYWNLFRFDPSKETGKFQLDSKAPKGGYQEFLMNEARYSRLTREFPERATDLFAKNEAAAKERWEHLNKLVEMYKD